MLIILISKDEAKRRIVTNNVMFEKNLAEK